jgi:hypothetical protein
MPKIVTFLVIVTLCCCPRALSQNCALSGTAAWSPTLRNVIGDCNNRFLSPDKRFVLEIGTEGNMTVKTIPDARKLGLNVRRIEPPAMVSWSPKSNIFFVNDGEGSGMSSVFRLFRLNGNDVIEDDSLERKAVSLYRRRVRCSSRSADPNVWGFGWEHNGADILILVQATTDKPCGQPDAFVTLVVRATDGAVLETLSKAQSRARFAFLLPPELFKK